MHEAKWKIYKVPKNVNIYEIIGIHSLFLAENYSQCFCTKKYPDIAYIEYMPKHKDIILVYTKNNLLEQSF
jgi:hypothetical protein